MAGSKHNAERVLIGIDLGTTHSLAAVMGQSGPIVLRDRSGEALVPSVVSFAPESETPLVGRAARDKTLELPERTVFSIKRLIGQAGEAVLAEAARLPYPVVAGARGLARVRIDGKELSPEEISAMVLSKVRDQAGAALACEVREAVVTVPAYFDDAQRQATRDAAALAGLTCLRILNEPTAASLAYGIDGSRDGTVLVYDLGGGTFDVSVLRIEDGVFRVLSTAGNTHLGGDDFDRLLGEKILAALGKGARDPSSPRVMAEIRRSAEGLKIRLSTEQRAELEIALAGGATKKILVTRAELEELIAPLVEETLACCNRAITDAGIDKNDLDEVVLVGGSTRVPLVRRRLAELIGKPPRDEVDPDLAVALGAAIQADVLAGGRRDLLLLDVIPLSLGIETMGGVVAKLILRNATIPTSVTEEFSTQVENQTAVDINIYQGERELVADCRKLGAFKLTGIPPAPAGFPRVAVTFLVDADGVLQVSAKEQRTGIAAGISVVPSFGLTREEVNRLMQESLEHAAEDMERREAIELRHKADAIARGTRSALALAELPPEQSWTLTRALRAIEHALEGEDQTVLRAAVEDLSRLTADLADEVISSAVRKALEETAS